MPRNGDGVWSDIPNITAVPGQTIESADWNNYRADLRDNEFNAARPITAGGTGATNAEDALSNLGGVGVSNFLDAYPIGDFYGSIRTLDASWLRRNGALYDADDYPELAALLPSLPDGITWTTLTPGTSSSITDIIENPDGGYLLVADGGTNSTVHVSSDGESWAIVATIPSFRASAVAAGNGIFVAVDAFGYVSVSNDGVSWSAPTLLVSGQSLVDVAFGAGLFVATGTNGIIRTSADGASWASPSSGVTAELGAVEFLNSSVFVIVGDVSSGSGVILTSSDGAAWTLRTSGVNENLYGVTYGAGLYVAVGRDGSIVTSANLSAWTIRASGVSTDLNAVLYTTSGFLAVGDSGVARISSNGTTWSGSATGRSSALNTICPDSSESSRYIVGGDTGTLIEGIRTLPTQFRVPNDDPTYGWIKALEEAP